MAVTGEVGRPPAELASLCRALKALHLAGAVGTLAEQARAESWTYEEFLSACLEREVAASQSNGEEHDDDPLAPEHADVRLLQERDRPSR
jgi:hypothetical protein